MSVDHKTIMHTLQAIADKYDARGVSPPEVTFELSYRYRLSASKVRMAIAQIKTVLAYESESATCAKLRAQREARYSARS